MHQIVAIAIGLLGAVCPLLGSALIPNGSQRWGAAIFALVGIGFFVSVGAAGTSAPFSIGLAIGFILATLKLTTGIRFL